jgi:hypothetical protein
MKTYRYIFIFILLIILFLSGLYNYSQPMGYEILLKDPVKNEGCTLTISGTIISKNDDSYILFDKPNNVKVIVKNNITKWKMDDFVSLRGIFHSQGYVEFIEGEVIWDKGIILILSILGFLALLMILYMDRKKITISFR